MSCGSCSCSCGPPLPTREDWLKKALGLAWLTVLYNLVEGGVSIGFGVADGSVSLWGFGLDSFVEVASALVVFWRLRDLWCAPAPRERKATLAIGGLFLVLALSVVTGSVIQLLRHEHPHSTLPGLVISLLSLSFMVYLWRAKRRVARALDSAALKADAACSLACIQLSSVLLAGSAVFYVAPELWWADAVAGLVLAVLIAREGIGMILAARKPDFQGGCGCD